MGNTNRETTSLKLGISTLGAIEIFLLSLNPADAAVLVEVIATTPNPEFTEVTVIPPEVLPEQPRGFTVPDSSGEVNFLNDTGFNMQEISALIITDELNGEPVVWGDANEDGQIGLSNIFAKVAINPDNTIFQQLDFEDGLIRDGEQFVFQFITKPDLNPGIPGVGGPITVATIYRGVPVPESSPVFGLVLLGSGYISQKIVKKFQEQYQKK